MGICDVSNIFDAESKSVFRFWSACQFLRVIRHNWNGKKKTIIQNLFFKNLTCQWRMGNWLKFSVEKTSRIEHSHLSLIQIISIKLCSVTQMNKLHCATKKKVSCEKKRPVDFGSWGPIKQPYVGRFSRSIRRDEFSTSKVWDTYYFYLIFSYVTISMKISETYRID